MQGEIGVSTDFYMEELRKASLRCVFLLSAPSSVRQFASVDHPLCHHCREKEVFWILGREKPNLMKKKMGTRRGWYGQEKGAALGGRKHMRGGGPGEESGLYP